MGKYLRPLRPGAAFHVTSRVQGREHRLPGPIRDRLLEFITRSLERCDVTLLAYAIMTNHLHLVVIQGEQALGRFMQPVLRSTALLVNRVDGTQGHVFERRFRAVPCRDFAHFRNSIGYAHLNPVKAGLCEDPGGYRWSSHRLYLDASAQGCAPVDRDRGLAVFGGREAYVSFLRRTMLVLAQPRDPDDASALPDAPYSSCPATTGDRRPLGQIAAQILAGSPHPLVPAELRSRWGPRRRLPLRRAFATAAAREGYAGREIAAYLQVSEPTVSRMLTTTRP